MRTRARTKRSKRFINTVFFTYHLVKILLTRFSKLLKLGDETTSVSSIQWKLKKILLTFNQRFRTLKGRRLRGSAKKAQNYIGSFIKHPKNNVQSMRVVASQFVQQPTKGYLDEIFRVSELCRIYSQQFKALKKKKLLFEKRIKFSTKRGVGRVGRRCAWTFVKTYLAKGRVGLAYNYGKLSVIKNFCLGVLGPTRWRIMFKYFNGIKLLKKKLTRSALLLVALKFAVQKRYFHQLLKKRKLKEILDTHRRRHKYLSWKSAAYAKKKNQNWVFKIGRPIIKRPRQSNPDDIFAARKKAFSGLNYRHFATQRKESLYRRGFFWQLVPGGRKYGALQKYRYKKRRKSLGWRNQKGLQAGIINLVSTKKLRMKNHVVQQNLLKIQKVSTPVKKKERKHEYGWKRKIYPRKSGFHRNRWGKGATNLKDLSHNMGPVHSHNQNYSGFNKHQHNNFRSDSRGGVQKDNKPTFYKNNSGVWSRGNTAAGVKKFYEASFQINKKPNSDHGVKKIFTNSGSRRKYSTAPGSSKDKKWNSTPKLRYFRKRSAGKYGSKTSQKKSDCETTY